MEDGSSTLVGGIELRMHTLLLERGRDYVDHAKYFYNICMENAKASNW